MTDSARIKVGDLVMMVRGHGCGLRLRGGVPFVVTGFVAPFGGGWTCSVCEQRNAGPNENAALGLKPLRKAPKGEYAAIPVSWLIKIDPPALSETTNESQEIVA